MRLFSDKTNPVWLSSEVSSVIWHQPPLDRGRDDSSPHITLQLRPDSAATGPARWRSQLGRTEAALWRMVPSLREIKSHRPWRRWPFCPRYDIQRDGKPEWKKDRYLSIVSNIDCLSESPVNVFFFLIFSYETRFIYLPVMKGIYLFPIFLRECLIVSEFVRGIS